MDDLEMAAYLDHRLSGTDRERAEAHLAGCAECRADLAESYQLRRRVRRPRRLAIGSLAAATAITLLIVRPGLDARRSSADEALLRHGADAAVIVAYGPLGETSLSPIRFVWGAQAGAASYRLTVTRSDGSAIWSHSSTDTAATLPVAIVLPTHERCLWVVDALLNDGGTRSTGLREFQLIR